MGSTESLEETSFAFRPLQHPQSIRILRLAPAASQDEDLIARLVEEPLEDAKDAKIPDYEALSYAWGTDPPTETLLVGNGSDEDAGETPSSSPAALSITPGLAAALRRFRQPDAVRCLWVDAVCINQSDNHEKSAQVARMAAVYRKARRVLIWLGEATCDTGPVLALLATVAARSEEFGLEKEVTSWLRFGKTLKGEFEDVYGLMLTTRQVRLGDILGRPWFTRLWIVQEVVLALEAVLHVGEHELGWDIFTTGMAVFAAGKATTGSGIGATANDAAAFARAWNVVDVVATHKVWEHVFGPVYFEVRGLLAALADQSCSDERDRIYAIAQLGLRTLKRQDIRLSNGDVVSTDLTPDYTKSVAQTYLDFARHMVMQGDLHVLLDAGLSKRLIRSDWGKTLTSASKPFSADKGGPLPSWVPDLSDPKTFRSASWTDPDGEFEAGGLLRWAQAAQLPGELRQLWVRVRPLGLVRRVLFLPDLVAYGAARDLSDLVRKSWEVAEAEADLAFYNMYETQNDPLLQMMHGISEQWTAFRRVESLKQAFARTLTSDGKGKVIRHEFSSDQVSEGVSAAIQSPRGLSILFQTYWRCGVLEDGELRQRWAAWMSGELRTAAAKEDKKEDENGSARFSEGLSSDACLAFRVERALQNTFAEQSFMTTTSGFIGIAPALAEPGDMVVLIAGLGVPYILRRVGQDQYLKENGDGESAKDGNDESPGTSGKSNDGSTSRDSKGEGESENQEEQRFVAIGPAYVHGFMYAEGALSGRSGPPLSAEWIRPSEEFRHVCLV